MLILIVIFTKETTINSTLFQFNTNEVQVHCSIQNIASVASVKGKGEENGRVPAPLFRPPPPPLHACQGGYSKQVQVHDS